MYNGEIITELRLKYLYNHVDKFYIVEGRFTHQGQKKEKLFFEINKELFEPYLSKIIFIENTYDNSKIDSFQRESHHRDYVTQYILENEKNNKYILSVCDCDEIPGIENKPTNDEIYELCKNGYIKMNQL
jgi:beta-1,4-mannosyl-glycoprotein beta-1,4-N-acetylglucosaminyltransferase